MMWLGQSANHTQLLVGKASIKRPWIGLWYPGNASNCNFISEPAASAHLPSTWVTNKKIFQGSARDHTAIICKLHKQEAGSQKTAWSFLITWNTKQSAVLLISKRPCSKEISAWWQKAALSLPVHKELSSPSWVVRFIKMKLRCQCSHIVHCLFSPLLTFYLWSHFSILLHPQFSNFT